MPLELSDHSTSSIVVSHRRWLVLLLRSIRFHLLLGMHEAGGLGFFRALRVEPMVQLVAAFYFVQIRARGGEWWPDLVPSAARLHMHRFHPFLGLNGAGGLGVHRVRRAVPVVQLVAAFHP